MYHILTQFSISDLVELAQTNNATVEGVLMVLVVLQIAALLYLARALKRKRLQLDSTQKELIKQVKQQAKLTVDMNRRYTQYINNISSILTRIENETKQKQSDA